MLPQTRVQMSFNHVDLESLFTWCPLFPMALLPFLPSLLQSSLSSKGKNLMEILFRAECFMVSYSLHIIWLWVSACVSIYCKKKFL